MSRRRHYNRNEINYINLLVIFLFIVAASFFIKYKEKVEYYGLFFLLLVLIAITIYLFTRKRFKNNVDVDYNDDTHIIGMLRGIKPEDFEKEIAAMFSRLGYETKTVGHSHDGGVDVEAKKDGDTYIIQCKRYTTGSVGVKEARELQGVVAAQYANKGFLITTNNFSPEVLKEFNNNPRIELVDILSLLKYYKASLKK